MHVGEIRISFDSRVSSEGGSRLLFAKGTTEVFVQTRRFLAKTHHIYFRMGCLNSLSCIREVSKGDFQLIDF